MTTLELIQYNIEINPQGKPIFFDRYAFNGNGKFKFIIAIDMKSKQHLFSKELSLMKAKVLN